MGAPSSIPHLSPTAHSFAALPAPQPRMRSTLLALAALCLLAVLHRTAGDGNAVKLCGRDFVRAIVFTCGGSRWKRDLAHYQYLFAESSESSPSSAQESGGSSELSPFAAAGLEDADEQSQEGRAQEERDVQRSRKVAVLKKREVAKLLTTSCCSVGCSERDISLLC
ncbi:insulin-like peptide INSL5 isoform X1 [Coturnix japonica]|uniref:insulin-like peptide INSL5 isoform X1 n=1 Tax=Coturnix japonica TaxID=93934 RepID=UPI000776D132|nr:insulin-like peptide INSL5 isoform X1 [Coturnix japonica]